MIKSFAPVNAGNGPGPIRDLRFRYFVRYPLPAHSGLYIRYEQKQTGNNNTELLHHRVSLCMPGNTVFDMDLKR